MTIGLRDIQPADFARELEATIVPELVATLKRREPGHCMRVDGLDGLLLVRVCGRLQADCPEATVVILDAPSIRGQAESLVVSSTKLVELRNPRADATQRPPLLVLIPHDARTSAEDSFGVATFESVELGNVLQRTSERLLGEAPAQIRGGLRACLDVLDGQDEPWPLSDDSSVCKFLLSAKCNGFEHEAIGASLFHLGLVPDFELFADHAKVPWRIRRNIACVSTLTWSAESERGRVLRLGLSKRAFRSQLASYLAEKGLEDPREWTRAIVMDRSLWPLAFNRWDFDDAEEAPESICIRAVSTDLPILQEEEATEKTEQLVGQQVLPLGRDGFRKFSVGFSADPHPSKVNGLERFVVQVISKEHGPIGLVRGKRKWKGASQSARVSFSKIASVDWEEGWHFVRVLAETDAGDLIPLVDEEGNLLPWSPSDEASTQRVNESDLFYVLPDGDVEVEPPQRAIPRDESVSHAIVRLRLAAAADGRTADSIIASEVGWSDRSSRGLAGSEQLEVRVAREGRIHIPVSRQLKALEQRILGNPSEASSWRAEVRGGVCSAASAESSQWPSCDAMQAFLDARAKYFECVRSGSKELITQGAVFELVADEAYEYARAYKQLLDHLAQGVDAADEPDRQQALVDLRTMLALDTVSVVLRDHRGNRRQAMLIAPTHPLRVLWYLTWMSVAGEWIKAIGPNAREFAAPARDTLLEGLAPLGFPAFLPNHTNELLVPVESITPFWSVYARHDEEDPRGLIGALCEALNVREGGGAGVVVDASYLSARVRRYILQHPYVDTIQMNVFNAGRGAMIAEMLIELQQHQELGDLRYDIRFFVADPEAPGIGTEIVELLSPSSGQSAPEADAFTRPSGEHLRSKLRFAVRSTADFRASPDQHAAHLTLLFDAFPSQSVGVEEADPREAVSPVHGLVQDYQRRYGEDSTAVSWHQQPRHGRATAIENAEHCSDLLAELASTVSSASAKAATGSSGAHLRPVVSLVLAGEDRALLHQVHEVSDWVFTIDRNMGVEFFDHGGHTNRPEYLLDFTPEGLDVGGRRLAITSRSLAELEALIRPVMHEYNLDATGAHAAAILGQLRCLSGRLALKLISAPSQRAEAFGLALSRMYLQHQGAFRDQIVVPLDAHLDLFQLRKKHSDEIGDDASLRRTDLAIFDLDANARTITFRLVEVKCYNRVGDVSAYTQLRAHIAEQLQQSQEVLAYHYDPHRQRPDRPDRVVKTRELSVTLEFYLDRAQRYGLIAPEAAEEARFFVRTLESGYKLAFTRSGLIFDFERPGTEVPDIEDGIEYHRIGTDLIRELISGCCPSSESEGGLPMSPPDDEGEPSPAAGVAPVRAHGESSSIPSLATAAFLSRPRERSVSWESLHAKHVLGVDEDEVQATSGSEMPQDLPARDSTVEYMVEEEAAQSSGEPPEVTPDFEGKPDSPPNDLAGSPRFDVILGATDDSPQYGLLGELSGRRVALDINQTHTISLFGVQGGGKSYTLGSIVEMATMAVPGVNELPSPLATVIFHYSPTMDYAPEFTSMIKPNDDEEQRRVLKEQYGVQPAALDDVVLLVPADKLEVRRGEHPGIDVHPIKFAAAELQTSHWRFLMGAVGNQATYIRQLNRIMKGLRDDLSLDGLRQAIESAPLPEHLKQLASLRLDLAAEYIDDSVRLREVVRPGRLIIVDLRDEFIEKDEALGLFVVLLQLFADATVDGRPFNKLVVFDEAHKYIESPDLVAGLIEVVREMRHKGTSILVASQDPPSVPVSLIELSSQMILHKFNSPAWLKHIQKANASLSALTPEKLAHLKPGEAYVWSSRASDDTFSQGAHKVRLRPRVSKHGGTTRTAASP